MNSFETGMPEEAQDIAAKTGMAIGFIPTGPGTRNFTVGCNHCDYAVTVSTKREGDLTAEFLDSALPLAFLSAVRTHCSHIKSYLEERLAQKLGECSGEQWLADLHQRQVLHDQNVADLAKAKPRKRKKDKRQRRRRK